MEVLCSTCWFKLPVVQEFGVVKSSYNRHILPIDLFSLMWSPCLLGQEQWQEHIFMCHCICLAKWRLYNVTAVFRLLGKTTHSCHYSLCLFLEGHICKSCKLLLLLPGLVIYGRRHHVTYICSYQVFLTFTGHMQISSFHSGNLKSDI